MTNSTRCVNTFVKKKNVPVRIPDENCTSKNVHAITEANLHINSRLVANG